MADDKISFELDLDTEEFVSAGEGAIALIKSIGNPEALSGLVEGLQFCVEALGAVALAAGAFKVALDMTVEGEKIQQVARTFQMLSESAGIAGKKLKEDLEEAAGGLVTTNELLASTNKALVELGPAASHLPEVMTLSRQAVALFGGDVKSTFDQMTQALAMGNQRWLKHHGILLDTEKALRDFANANGVAVDSLSQAGKQQALFNAGLESAKARFAGVSTEVGQTTTAVQAMKAAWGEFAEFVDVTVSKLLGPKLTGFFNSLKKTFQESATWMKSSFGEGAEQTAAQTERLTAKVTDLKKHIEELQTGKGRGVGIDPGPAADQVRMLESELKKYQTQLDQVNVKKKAQAAEDTKDTDNEIKNKGKVVQASIVDQQKLKESELKFQSERIKIIKATDKEEIQQMNSIAQIDMQLQKQALEARRMSRIEIQKINADKALDERQKMALVAAENKRFEAQKVNQARQAMAERLKLDANYLANSKNMYQGIQRAAQTQANSARAELQDYGKMGTTVYKGLSKTATDSFGAIGAAMVTQGNVAQAAADAMKKAFLGFIGEAATHYGEMLLLEGIFPPNPPMIAAGAALIALGGALGALAGGGGASVSTGGGGGGGGSTGALGPSQASPTQSLTDQSQAASQQQQTQRTVSVNIAGNYLNTQESQRTLMEVMRNETDATGFQYNKIGV